MAFSTKVTAGSSASPTPSSPCATGLSPSGASNSVSSRILPWLLLAITSVSVMAGSVVEQGVGEPDRQILIVADRAGCNIERDQLPGGVLVFGNKIHRLTFLNAPE